MLDPMPPLHTSVRRLRDLVGLMPPAQLTTPAYPTEWTIADVLSHLGSGAVIFQRRSEDALHGESSPEDFATSVWDEWNGKSPSEQAADALTADALVLDHLDAVSSEDWARGVVAIGPLSVDFTTYVGLRLNEHVLHTWDVEVAIDPTATLPSNAAEVVIDNLGLIAQYTAKPTGSTETIRVHTVDPDRLFAVSLTPESVTVSQEDHGDADLEIPAEAFIRLVYGRLDPEHTPPAGIGERQLVKLRQVFPGP
jgi:uncharacterized protein (TIGR03083 family)